MRENCHEEVEGILFLAQAVERGIAAAVASIIRGEGRGGTCGIRSAWNAPRSSDGLVEWVVDGAAR